MAIQCIIFDCDGTLVDTEFLCAKAFTDTLKPYGIDYTPQKMLDDFMGVANVEIAAALSARFGIDLPAAPITKKYTEAVSAEMDQHMRVHAESVAYVRSLAAKGYKLAVGSNGTRDVVFEELAVAGYLDFIPRALVFTAADVKTPKPAPEMYLKAAAACGVAPEHCVVVEDSATGARAGLAAGMRTVGYTGLAHDLPAQEAALKKAGVTRIIKVLTELDGHLS